MNRTIGAILLIIGLSIGPPILALPFSLSVLGFPLSIVLFILLWALMLYTGLLLLEVNLWFMPGINMMNMARKCLGKPASYFVWVCYVLFCYSLLAAYLTGGGSIVSASFSGMQGLFFPDWVGAIPWVLICGLVLYFGPTKVDYLNRLLMLGFAACFAMILTYSADSFNFQRLTGGNSHYFLLSAPIIMVAFCYHFLIPSIRDYLQGDVKHIKLAIVIATFITLALYVVWILVLFSALPYQGKDSLMTLQHSQYPVVTLLTLLDSLAKHPWMVALLRLFGFYTITSSFLAVAFSCFDFFADSFSIKKNKKGKLILLATVFIPPFIYTILYPTGFITSLNYTGIFVAILFVILPAVMVWSGRYIKQFSFGYKTPGGRVALSAVILLAFSIIYLQIKVHG